MGQISDESGNIITRQGDTFYIRLTNIDPLLGGTLYAQVINNKRQMMFQTEPSVNIYGLSEVDLKVPPAQSDLLVVGRTDEYAEYQYAVKHCDSAGNEDTWFLGDNKDFALLPTITVYPKVVEGGIGAVVPEEEETPEEETTEEEENTDG